MSTLGKILIVVQVVMSVLFMCAAGAVYVVHTNWKTQYETAQQTLQEQRASLENDIEELNKQIDDLQRQAAAEKDRADAVVGDNQRLEAEVADLRRENNTLNQQLQTQTGIAEASADEAELRQAEAEQQRVVNETLRDSLDEQVRENRQLRDENFTLVVANENLIEQYTSLLEQVAFLERVVSRHGLSTDPREVEGIPDPPPPVDGVVVQTQKDRTNRTKFVHISIGSDDGLQVGHELDVYRSADRNGGEGQYLGRIRIIHLMPDQAVGLVVDAARNGIIERGDNVTTRL